jgi:hypothetical protein
MNAMRNPAPCNIGEHPAPFPLPGRIRPGGFALVAVIILMGMMIGCGSDHAPDRGITNPSPGTDTSPMSNKPASVVVFPQHHAPLGTDRGGEYFAAQLVLKEGCLRAEVSSKYDPNDPGSWLLIWPNGFTFATESETVRVVDELGRVVAQIGDHIRLSRAEQATERELVIGTVEGLCRALFPGGRRGQRLRSRVRGH